MAKNLIHRITNLILREAGHRTEHLQIPYHQALILTENDINNALHQEIHNHKHKIACARK